MSTDAKPIKFRRHMKVGSAAAETDYLLEQAFLDTGYIDVLTDTRRPESIVLGRTGSGKSALLLHIENIWQERALRIHPEALSLQYISNSTIIPYLDALDIHLELFYKLLWRHVLVVELLKDHYSIHNREKQEDFFGKLSRYFGTANRDKEAALDFIREWGDEFWKEPETRVKQVTNRLRNKVAAKFGGTLGPIEAALEGESEEGSERREEIRKETQAVVQDIQIKRLQDAIRIVQDDILSDPQKPYFLIIDDLDKKWVDARYTYDLLAMLIEVIGDFAKMDNIGVLAGLRTNIVARIQEKHTPKGQQREKQDTLMLPIRWRSEELTDMMDKRVRSLIRGKYGQEYGLAELLPDRPIQDKNAVEYILERTFMRPRDFIAYINMCIAEAVNKSGLTWSIIWNVEPDYSRSRVRAVVDEWQENYPRIGELFEILYHKRDGFRPEDIDQSKLYEVLERGYESGESNSITAELFEAWVGGNEKTEKILHAVAEVLFKVGVIGVDRGDAENVVFGSEKPRMLEFGLSDGEELVFHPAVYKAFHIQDGRRAMET